MDKKTLRAGYDDGWKWMLEQHFEECMQYYFPRVWEAIDWSHPIEFIESELQGEPGEKAMGKRSADKVAKVMRKDGKIAELFVHVEAQGNKQGKRREQFERRMLTYWYRIADKKETHPISLAILTDRDETWRPDHYEYEDLGCKIRLDFPMVKLLDYKGKEAELLESPNPFALVTVAHLRIMKMPKGNDARLAMKVELIDLLRQRGYSAEYRASLLRFLDWIMPLPESYHPLFMKAIEKLDEKHGEKMEMLTTWERYARKEGREEGREEGIEEGVVLGQIRTLKRLLTRKFGELPDEFLEQLDETTEQAILDSIEMQILFVNGLDEIVFDASVDEDEES